MNGDTKRRIDNARDVLVGKIPDPKSQVEHITLALVYRYMDYMDRQAEAMGGKASFFANGYEKYAWSNLVDRSIGGYERLDLYTEALIRMEHNLRLPDFFRQVFHNANQAYRDPETLRLFLTEINEFPLDHTEDLGDAYEYLLSVMSAQGDAGQFRTPRHIIDFIVRCVDPKKDETILDPACGTAGFLVCAYLHIMAQNAQDGRPGAALSTDEKKALVDHFSGYDISPEMARLALVNMYFHGFQSPSIHEYDTLSSEDRWDETYDVIMANPPFMTPKGGIRPHKRFSVQANRSEVLFVDYIAEHLSPSGRAGIIVPEGIIFQSSNAYKALRKMLVEDRYVYAVVSLPAGIFQPYSGVKTSILLMDREVAKRTDSILFVKVENDGFDLGAQRRPIENSDLPAALEVVTAWKRHIADPSAPFAVEDGKRAHVVPKAKIASSGDYGLLSDRYREAVIVHNGTCPLVRLGDIIRSAGKQRAGSNLYPVMSITMHGGLVDQSSRFKSRIASSDISGYKTVLRGELVVGFPIDEGVLGFQQQYDAAAVSPAYDVWRLQTPDETSIGYLEIILRSDQARSVYTRHMQGSVSRRRSIPREVFLELCIPLPPLEVQERIVAEIDAWQKIIDGARQVIANYKPTIAADPDWPTVELGSVSEWITKGTTPTTYGRQFQRAGISFIKIESIGDDGEIDPSKVAFIDEACHGSLKRSQLRANDVLFSIAGTKMGITAFVTEAILPANTNQALAIVRVKEFMHPRFVFHYLRSLAVQAAIEQLKIGVAQFNLSLKQVSEIQIPLPPIETQHAIVAEIEAEQKLIEANKRLIEIHEQKIKAKIAKVWGE